MEEPKTHLRYSPSAAMRWTVCSASMLDDAPAAESGTSVFAAEGTAAHSVVELAVLNKPLPEPGDLIVTDGYKIVVDFDMIRHANSVRRYVEQVQQEALDDVEVMAEVKVFPFENYEELIGGTADLILYAPDDNKIEVVDYKYGVGVVVEPENNLQLMLYARGAVEMLAKKYSRASIEDAEVELTIIQPRAPHPSGPVRTHKMHVDGLFAQTDFIPALIDHIEKTGDTTEVLGPHCKFCKRAAVCTALTAKAKEVADDPPVIKKDYQNKADAARLSEYLELAIPLKEWIAATEKLAIYYLSNGATIAGYKLVESRKHRAWRDDVDAVLLYLYGVDNPHAAKKLVTPAQLMKSETEDPEVLSEVNDNLIYKPPGKAVLATEQDRRPNYFNLSEEFPNE